MLKIEKIHFEPVKIRTRTKLHKHLLQKNKMVYYMYV